MSNLSLPLTLAPPARSLASGGFLLAQFILIWTTFFVLSTSINWPASLDDPASITLPRLLENEGAVLFGYACYLLAALLIIPATAALNSRLGLTGSLADMTMGLAIVSALAKAIGICRWLFAMPNLARSSVEPGSNQEMIAIIFNTLNDYAGGIGEIIGVGLTSGIWTVVFGFVLLVRNERRSRMVGGFAMLAGASLFLTIPAGFGVELGPVLTISNIAWQFALLFIAIWTTGRSSAA